MQKKNLKVLSCQTGISSSPGITILTPQFNLCFSAVGITNQRETTVVWDKLTGEPLHNAISNKMCLLLRETVTSNLIQLYFPHIQHRFGRVLHLQFIVHLMGLHEWTGEYFVCSLAWHEDEIHCWWLWGQNNWKDKRACSSKCTVEGSQ